MSGENKTYTVMFNADKEFVKQFDTACRQNKLNRKDALMKLMQSYINKNKEVK